MTNADRVISVTDVSKTYAGWFGRRKVRALAGVTFDVHRGEIFGLLGPNGAGKTTLVKILLGIARNDRGRAELLGRRAGKASSRREVGYLPEHLKIPGHHSARSALMLYGQLSGMTRAEVRHRREPLLERVGLADRAREPIKKFSKGMLQRLGLAQALLHDPQVVFLDEPTDGLDPVARAEVRRWLEELKQQGKTIFINSHLLQEIELVCDRVAVLNLGRLCAVGSVEELALAASDRFAMTIVMEGSGEAIRRALAGEQKPTALTTDDSRYEWRGEFADQKELNRLIDALRGADVDLIELRRERRTLEDAFLGLVGPSDGPSESSPPPRLDH